MGRPLAFCALCFALAGAAAAAEPGAPRPHGASCGPLFCAPAPRSALGTAAGFATAAATALALARRESSRRRR
jgi:hypothetical protein